MIKICILIGSGFPVPATKGGAVETLLETIIHEYEKHNNDFELTIITRKDSNTDYSQFHKVKFVFIPKTYIVFERVYWKIYGFCNKIFKVEIIAPLPRVFEKRYITKNKDAYDYFIEEISLNIYKKMNIPPKKIIYHLHYGGEKEFRNDKYFGYLIAISDYVESNWVRSTYRDATTAFLLKNCIDIEKFNKSMLVSTEERKRLKGELGIVAGNRVITFVGRIVPQKGVLELVKAFKKVNHSNVSLLIIGSSNFSEKTMTEYEEKVLKEIKTSTKQIITTGFIHNDQIYKYHSVTDIAVVPSIWQEPAGLVILEFQAAGIPVIASKIGGIPEFASKKCKLIATDNIIDNIAEGIDELIDNEKELNEMKKAGLEFAKNYNKEKYYANFVNIIEEINIKNEKLKAARK